MKRILAGGAVLLWLIIGHAHAGEITCPAVTDIRRNIETVEDVFFVDIQDGHEWESESLVDVVDPSSLRFEGAKYVIHDNRRGHTGSHKGDHHVPVRGHKSESGVSADPGTGLFSVGG
ncbi:hypothetical protein [Pseudomonas brassicacearum]|uniref:hypothetical protein n=1 Tax=Pseudomonas brassicacearum TaxID=930166 RepID=UPI0039DFFCEE